jgi:hypothetical protein
MSSTIGNLLQSPLMWLVVIGVGYFLISGTSLGNLLSTAATDAGSLVDDLTYTANCIIHPIDCPGTQWLFKEGDALWKGVFSYSKEGFDLAKTQLGYAGEDIKGGLSKAGNWISSSAQNTGHKIAGAAQSVEKGFLNTEKQAVNKVSDAARSVGHTVYSSEQSIKNTAKEVKNGLSNFEHSSVAKIKDAFSWL